jgi:hypothetical protein
MNLFTVMIPGTATLSRTTNSCTASAANARPATVRPTPRATARGPWPARTIRAATTLNPITSTEVHFASTIAPMTRPATSSTQDGAVRPRSTAVASHNTHETSASAPSRTTSL